MIIVFAVVGAIAAALAFHFTRSGKLNFGGEGAVRLVRLTIAATVLFGFLSLGFNLAGFEELGGGLNPWWLCLVFWAQSALATYTIFEYR